MTIKEHNARNSIKAREQSIYCGKVCGRRVGVLGGISFFFGGGGLCLTGMIKVIKNSQLISRFTQAV